MTKSFFRRDLVGPLCQAIMESLWLHAYVLVLTTLSASSLRLSFLATAAPQLGCVLLARASRLVKAWFLLQRVMLLAASALWLAIWLHEAIVPHAPWSLDTWSMMVLRSSRGGIELRASDVILAWLIAVYGGARGLVAGIVEQTAPLATRWFMVGAFAFISLFLFLAGSRVPLSQLPVARLGAITVCYFTVGMWVVARASHRSVYAGEGLRSQASLAFVLATSVPAALVAVAALAVAGGMQTARWILARTIEAVDWSVAMLWFVARTLGHGLHEFLVWLGQLDADKATATRDAARRTAARTNESWTLERPRWTITEWDVLPALLLCIALLLVVVFLIMLFRKQPPERDGETVEESESLWSWSMMLHSWRSFLSKSLLGWRSQRFRRPASARLSNEAGLHDIRQIYRALLRWAAQHGHVRARDMTTLEFASRVARDHGSAEVDPITLSYNAARYGERTVPEAELERARRKMRALEARAPAIRAAPGDNDYGKR